MDATQQPDTPPAADMPPADLHEPIMLAPAELVAIFSQLEGGKSLHAVRAAVLPTMNSDEGLFNRFVVNGFGSMIARGLYGMDDSGNMLISDAARAVLHAADTADQWLSMSRVRPGRISSFAFGEQTLIMNRGPLDVIATATIPVDAETLLAELVREFYEEAQPAEDGLIGALVWTGTDPDPLYSLSLKQEADLVVLVTADDEDETEEEIDRIPREQVTDAILDWIESNKQMNGAKA